MKEFHYLGFHSTVLTSVHSAMRFTGWGVKNALLAGVFRPDGVMVKRVS
jgi:hypothetical protein